MKILLKNLEPPLYIIENHIYLNYCPSNSLEQFIYTFITASEIQNIDFSVTSDDALIVSWAAHLNPKLCSVQYRITYLDDAKQLGAVQTSETQAWFKVVYCVQAQIVLQHVSPFSSSNDVPTIVDAPNSKFCILKLSNF